MKRVQKKKNRCFTCRAKIGLTGLPCRCGFVFCAKHVPAEAHECDFDFSGTYKKHLAKVNVGVTPAKLQRL